MVTEVAPGLHRMALPLGIHGVETVSAYLLAGGDGRDTLVDCGIAAAVDPGRRPRPGRHRRPRGRRWPPAAAGSSGSSASSSPTPTSTTSVWPGRSCGAAAGELWMHRSTELDLAKYDDPDEAVDRRELMLADHGLYGPELTETLARAVRLAAGDALDRPAEHAARRRRAHHGGRPDAGRSCTHRVTHPATSACGAPTDRLLCSGDHLLQVVSPPVTFERGFETDPMGSYLESLERVGTLAPDLVLPGHGAPFRDGARRAASISRNKLRRLTQIREMVEARERTVTELTAELFPTAMTAAQRHFAMAEILAYLAHHEVRGVLARGRRPDGVFVWRPAGLTPVRGQTDLGKEMRSATQSTRPGRVP